MLFCLEAKPTKSVGPLDTNPLFQHNISCSAISQVDVVQSLKVCVERIRVLCKFVTKLHGKCLIFVGCSCQIQNCPNGCGFDQGRTSQAHREAGCYWQQMVDELLEAEPVQHIQSMDDGLRKEHTIALCWITFLGRGKDLGRKKNLEYDINK